MQGTAASEYTLSLFWHYDGARDWFAMLDFNNPELQQQLVLDAIVTHATPVHRTEQAGVIAVELFQRVADLGDIGRTGATHSFEQDAGGVIPERCLRVEHAVAVLFLVSAEELLCLGIREIEHVQRHEALRLRTGDVDHFIHRRTTHLPDVSFEASLPRLFHEQARFARRIAIEV